MKYNIGDIMSRTEYVIRSIKIIDGKKFILDVGFLGGYETPFIHDAIISNMNNYDKLIGIDINLEIKKFKNIDNIKYENISIFDYSEKSNEINVVVFCEVFEHLRTPYLSIEKIYSILKRGGILIMTYPNPLSIERFVRFLISDQKDKNFLKLYRGADDHLVFPMVPCLVNYLEAVGFEIIDVSFLKGRFSRFPYLNKFSSYIGMVAQKK